MADQPSKSLTDIEKEAAHSYREWPIYIVMRLKRLQAIQEKLRVDGTSPSAILRREELLKAVYDNTELEAAAREIATETGVTMDKNETTGSDDFVEYDIDTPPPANKATEQPPAAQIPAKSQKARPKTEASGDGDSDYLDDVDYDA